MRKTHQDNAPDLHVHSNFSILDGQGSPKDIVRRAVELGWRSAALTELPDRIRAKIEVVSNGCWLWRGWVEERRPGKLSYGKVWWEGTMRYAHRIVFQLLVGEVPSGQQLDHLCGEPSCVNPAHLEPVTAKENTRRGNTGQNMVAKIKCFCGECPTCRSRAAMRRYRAKNATK
jgi:hypothetical protein